MIGKRRVKQAGQAALMGAAVGVGFDIAQKVWNGEDIKGEELVETALKERSWSKQQLFQVRILVSKRPQLEH